MKWRIKTASRHSSTPLEVTQGSWEIGLWPLHDRIRRVKAGSGDDGRIAEVHTNLQSWKKVLGNMHFFSENFPFSISPSPLPLSKLNLRAEIALFRSNIDQGGGGTSLCANVTFQSVENRAISEHLSYFEAVPRTFVQDCLNSRRERKMAITPTRLNVLRLNLDCRVFETLCTYSIYIWVILNRFIA